MEGWVTEFTGIRTPGMFDDGFSGEHRTNGAQKVLETEDDHGCIY